MSCTALDLGTNRIGSEGARHVASMLSTNTVLTSLGLGSNRIGDEGAVALASALKVISRDLP